MKIYFISGLAADSRVFKYIQLPSYCEPVYLDWIPPQKNEELSSYALRMAEKINFNERFSIIGLSFGGMIASEIAKHHSPVHTILIASIPSSEHLPGYYRMARSLGLHKIIPVSFFRSAALMKRLFTTETEEDKEILRAMIRQSDPHFIRWALEAILYWDSKDLPPNLVHLHGSKDEILPKRYTKPSHIIPKAGHLMVMNRSGEINKILQEVLV